MQMYRQVSKIFIQYSSAINGYNISFFQLFHGNPMNNSRVNGNTQRSRKP
jgi:hypothetical protein